MCSTPAWVGRPRASRSCWSRRRTQIGDGVTDADGRIGSIGPDRLGAGDYTLRFDTGSYFADAGRDCFYPEVVVVFTIADPDQHYHVPVLLNPFGYGTYRGT